MRENFTTKSDPASEETPMQIKWEMSFGNISSMIVTIVSVGSLIWWLSNELTELRGADQLFNLKIERLEADMKVARLDREMIIDMRADIRVLHQYMDELIRRYPLVNGAPKQPQVP